MIMKTVGGIMWDNKQVVDVYRPLVNLLSEATWRDVGHKILGCRSCTIRPEATRPVLPEGDPASEFVFVGRNPGKQEDRYGRPFYPKALGGGVYESLLSYIGLTRRGVYTTNACFCYTAKNRPPITTELMKCVAWKVIESRLLKPKAIILFGNDAIRQTMGLNSAGVQRCFGDVYQTRLHGRRVLIVPVYHPAYLGRNPSKMKEMFDHILRVKLLVDADREGRFRWRV